MTVRANICVAVTAAVTAVTVACGGAHAEVEFSEDTKFYSVYGASEAELQASLNAHAPTVRGERFAGYTQWDVSWRPYFEETARACELSKLSLRVTATTRLPKWRFAWLADDALRRKWARFHAALSAHEAQHRAFGVAVGRETERALNALGARRTCAALEREARQAFARILQKHQQREREFDKRTQHGASTGAKFP